MTATVVAHLPAVQAGRSTGLAEELAELLGPSEARPTVTVEPVEGDRAWWTVDGRPAVVGPADSIAMSVEAALERLLRRPGLVLGNGLAPGSAAAYLADLGLARARLAHLEIPPDRPAYEVAEPPMTAEPMVIEAPTRVLERTSPDDDELASRLRERLLTEHGLMLPRIVLRPRDDWTDGARVRINDVLVPLPGLEADQSWGEVLAGLDRAMGRRLHWLLRAGDIAAGIEHLGYLMPDLAQASSETYPILTLTAVLREHVRRGGHLRNLGRLLWLLLDLGQGSSGPDRLSITEFLPWSVSPPAGDQDPAALASLLRKALIEDAWRVGLPVLPARVTRLSAATEEALTSAGPAAAADAEWAVIEEVAQLDEPYLLVVRTVAAVAPLVDCLRALDTPPEVLAADELPPDVDLGRFPVATEARTGV